MSESIKVAVRIRPLVDSEISRGCQTCLDVVADEQVIVRGEKAFTYNYVFDQKSPQERVYEVAVQDMVRRLFEGFNVTILAYGQTGSGKTHTMGTAYAGEGDMGVIPRAVYDIFTYVDAHPESEFHITVSFMELYKEQLYDLLAPDKAIVEIREDIKGICMPGLTEAPVTSVEKTMKCLMQGSSGRVTGSTAMNNQSSRSHAIFTMTIHQQKRDDSNSAVAAKFHLVDLAGSERSKKTQAVGDRFKEGVNINFGLLALGNVISALGEGSKQVPSYRNSKLTRLLQDSLGGNSFTLMIACVSPADYNLEETMSTLRYADRARRIKNKPIINQDSKSAEINELKRKVHELQLELNCVGSRGGDPAIEQENKKLNAKLRLMTQRYNDALNENTVMCERVLLAEAARDRMKQKVQDMEAEMTVQIQEIDKVVEDSSCSDNVKERLDLLKKSWTSKMKLLQEEQKRSETEMWAHESSETHDEGLCASMDDLSALAEIGQSDLEELDQKQEQLAAKQTQLNKELRELTRQLALKEEVCEKYSRNTLLADENFKQSQKLYEQYEKQIADLLKERTELINSINRLKSLNKEGDLKAKQTELSKKNTEIENLQKKLAEQAKIVKQKEAAEKKVELLNSEIIQMKQAKVKLIRQMKTEGEKFRIWRIEREREASKLRDQDRRRQNEMARMQSLHFKQQNVFKRKLEEAAACNKRLKEALLKQKSVQEKRALLRGNKEQVQEFVAHELEVLVSTLDAEKTLQQLLEDRALITAQVNELKNVIDDLQTNPECRKEAEEETARAKQELELRNTQIADLQQKILDSDQENKSNTRWDAIQSMADAKAALKHVFNLVAEIRREAMTKDQTFKETEANFKEANKRLRELEKELKKMKEKHEEEILLLEKEHQEQLHCLLNSTENKENIPENSYFDRTLTAKQLKLLQSTEEELKKKQEECTMLQNQISTILTVAQTPKPKPLRKRRSKHREFEDLNWTPDGSFVDDCENDCIDADPDWRMTPIHRRLTAIKSKTTLDAEPRKRGFDGSFRCGCHTNCGTKRCVCFKMGTKCGDSCLCDSSKCLIKGEQKASSSLNETYTKIDDTGENLKKPRHTYTNPSL